MPSSNRSGAAARHTCVAAILVLALSGCATGYGRRGVTGGYSDERVDDTHYVVSFNGNGFASKDRVWYFWFYRCAELTMEKGFTWFEIVPTKKKGEPQSRLDVPPASPFQPAVYHPASGALPTEPAGYVYIPPTTVTTWSSSAVVAMYTAVPKGKIVLSAPRVLELLGPFVQSNGSDVPPERKVLFRGAIMMLGDGEQPQPERVFPDGDRIGYVDMSRLLDGVAEGKAARARLKASFAKKQSQLDAAMAPAAKVKRAVDGEKDPARKAALQADLDARVKVVKELRARLQAEVEDEEKRAVAELAVRAKPVIERVRMEQKLDGVTDRGVASLCEADVTAEVIRLYEERFGSHGAT